MSNITRNSLASPDLLGISAGAGLGAVILILLAPSSPPGLLPLFAFAGGLLTAVIIYLLAWQKGVESTTDLDWNCGIRGVLGCQRCRRIESSR
ncbi:iron chelate uptake ABC transporter family permease subunit [Polycladomyces subterraneus]|uniref:iron chelate uptake ABC transporter family permease subunit n=1 Tax=Polycladomyces subterraneus TaxID=1016997 RepID=UPI00342C3586